MLAFVLHCGLPADAFEIFPEYRSLTADEPLDFDWPNEIDSEYTSDVLAFTPSPAWDRSRFDLPKHGQMALGSLNGNEFLMRRYLQLQHPLSSSLTGQFLYFEQGDLDEAENHFITELRWQWTPHWALAVYGELAHLKEENDIGAALVISPVPSHSLRIYRTWVDFDRNIRTRGENRFAKYPAVYGMMGLFKPNHPTDFLTYSFRWEDEARWLLWESAEEYSYKNWAFSSSGNLQMGPGSKMMFRILVDEKTELMKTLNTEVIQNAVVRQRQKGQLAHEISLSDFGLTHITYGMVLSHHIWQVHDKGQLAFQQTAPYVNVQWQRYSLASNGEAWWESGVEMTHHQTSGNQSLRKTQVKPAADEYRLNLWWNWQFSQSGTFRLAMTADLDQLLTPVAFEGGGAFLQIAL